MNISATIIALAVALFPCVGDLVRAADNESAESRNIGLDPDQPEIMAFIQYLKSGGVVLERDHPRIGVWWRVAGLPADSQIVVSVRTLPPGLSEQQMRDALLPISLAYMLNPHARLAMSYPPSRGVGAAGQPLWDNPTASRLANLFVQYRPSEDKREAEPSHPLDARKDARK